MGDKLGVTGLTLYDGKLWGNYRAIVLDNNDPLQLGRIKAEVIPYFVGIDASILPWAVPKNAMSGGAAVGSGSSNIPIVGSKVWVFFEFGDIYQPVYDGEASGGISGLPSFISTNYPNSRGFQTPSGVQFFIDDTTQTVTVNHPSGAYITIGTTGIITVSGTQVQINPTPA